jgi:alpha-D-xyloside xylohydrolase
MLMLMLMLQLTETYSLDQQFMFGPAMLVAPVMEPGSSSVEVFLPASERWFDAHTGVEVSKSSGWLSSSNKTTHQV